MGNWTADLALGTSGEELAISLYVFADMVKCPKKRFKEWDFGLKNHKEDEEYTYFECKNDRRAKDTGNLAIEYECSKKPSGISTTKADFYVYFIEGTRTWYEIPTDDIRTLINEKKYTRNIAGGDGWKTRMYLFPCSMFESYKNEY